MPLLRKPALSVALFAGAIATLPIACVQPTNPLDPDTPIQNQARATLRGTAQAVFALAEGEVQVGPVGEGETLVEAAFCPAREGDHSGFDIVLREQASTDGNPLVGRTQQSNASGEFVFEGIPPGNYVLELVRPGFSVPAPQPILLRPSDDVTLDPLCALNRVVPERPALGGLPLVVDGNNIAAGAPDGTAPQEIEILNCVPGVRYVVDQRPEEFPDFDQDLSVVIETDGTTPCTAELAFFDVSGASARTTWRVSAVAIDPLDNTSESVSAFVVRDTLAPPAPTALRPQVGRDRVFLEWTQDPVLNDDSATGWLVSYGLAARPEDTADPCPYGAPLDASGDAFDTASFAVQGRSPVAVAEIGATLSGILEGTTLFLQVAAKDAAGNLSCWSSPVAVRPDVVAPAIEGTDALTTTGVIASTFGPQVSAFARGTSGVVIRRPGGEQLSLEGLNALDVDAVGRRVYIASGASGINVATVLATGQLSSTEISGIGTINSVDANAGRLFAGTDTGLITLDPDAPGDALSFDPTCRESSVTDVSVDGDVIIATRDDGATASLQVTHRSLLECASDTVALDQAPSASLVVGDQLWLAVGTRVVAYDFGACREPAAFDPNTCCANTPSSGCLDELFSIPLQAQARPTSLQAWDDAVLVGANGGALPSSAVVVLDPQPIGPPLTVGVGFTSDAEPIFAVAPVDGGFCAYTDASRSCFRTTSGPLAEQPFRLTSAAGGSVEFAVPYEGGVVMFSSAPGGALDRIESASFDGLNLAQQILPDDVPVDVPANLARRLFVANTFDRRGDVVTLDSLGRLYRFSSSSSASSLERADTALATLVSSAWADATHPDDNGFVAITDALVDVDGSKIVVFASNQLRSTGNCAPAALITIEMAQAVDGTFDVAGVDALDLGPLGTPTALTVDNGTAWIASEPYTVRGVNLDSLTLDAAPAFGGANVCDDAVDGALAFGVSAITTFDQRRLVSAGAELVDGTPRNILEVAEGEFVFSDVGEISAVGGAGRFVALASAAGEVLLYDVGDLAAGATLIPSVSLPTGTRPLSIAATRRGVLFADGPAGVVIHRLR